MTISRTDIAELAMQATLDDLTNAWLDARAEREKLDDRIADLDAVILANLAPGETHSLPGLPGVGIKVAGPSRRLDKALAASMLTPEQLAAASEPVLTAAKVKETLPGWLVDMIIVADPNGKRSVQAIRAARR